MSRAYTDIAFTPTVRAMQTRMGSRANYAPLDHTDDRRDELTEREAEFIHARDGFYQATVGETGWPYVQFRGGPAGFLKVLEARTLGYADFRFPDCGWRQAFPKLDAFHQTMMKRPSVSTTVPPPA